MANYFNTKHKNYNRFNKPNYFSNPSTESQVYGLEDSLEAQGVDVPAKSSRSGLQRAIDAISVTTYPIMGALKNVTDNDPNTTGLSGAWEGLKASNPFGEGNPSGRAYFSDTLTNAGWESQDNPNGKWYNPLSWNANNVAKGLTGFVGDVLLDPITYATFGTGALAKGTGSAVLKGVAKEGFQEGVEQLSRNNFDEIGQMFSKYGVDKYDDFGQDVLNKVNRDAGITQTTRGVGFHVPFTKKSYNIVSPETMRELGDKTIAPYMNNVIDKFQKSSIGEYLGKTFNTKYASDDRAFARAEPVKHAESIVYKQSVAKEDNTFRGLQDKLIEYTTELFKDTTKEQQKALAKLMEAKGAFSVKTVSVPTGKNNLVETRPYKEFKEELNITYKTVANAVEKYKNIAGAEQRVANYQNILSKIEELYKLGDVDYDVLAKTINNINLLNNGDYRPIVNQYRNMESKEIYEQLLKAGIDKDEAYELAHTIRGMVDNVTKNMPSVAREGFEGLYLLPEVKGVYGADSADDLLKHTPIDKLPKQIISEYERMYKAYNKMKMDGLTPEKMTDYLKYNLNTAKTNLDELKGAEWNDFVAFVKEKESKLQDKERLMRNADKSLEEARFELVRRNGIEQKVSPMSSQAEYDKKIMNSLNKNIDEATSEQSKQLGDFDISTTKYFDEVETNTRYNANKKEYANQLSEEDLLANEPFIDKNSVKQTQGDATSRADDLFNTLADNIISANKNKGLVKEELLKRLYREDNKTIETLVAKYNIDSQLLKHTDDANLTDITLGEKIPQKVYRAENGNLIAEPMGKELNTNATQMLEGISDLTKAQPKLAPYYKDVVIRLSDIKADTLAAIKGNHIYFTGKEATEQAIKKDALPHEIAHHIGTQFAQKLFKSGTSVAEQEKFAQDFVRYLNKYSEFRMNDRAGFDRIAKLIDSLPAVAKQEAKAPFKAPFKAPKTAKESLEYNINRVQGYKDNLIREVNNMGVSEADAIKRLEAIDDMLLNPSKMQDKFVELNPTKYAHTLEEQREIVKDVFLNPEVAKRLVPEVDETIYDLAETIKQEFYKRGKAEGIKNIDSTISTYITHMLRDKLRDGVPAQKQLFLTDELLTKDRSVFINEINKKTSTLPRTTTQNIADMTDDDIRRVYADLIAEETRREKVLFDSFKANVNPFKNDRKWGDKTIEEVNKIMGDGYFEDNVARIYLNHGLKHNQILYSQNYYKTLYENFGTTVAKQADILKDSKLLASTEMIQKALKNVPDEQYRLMLKELNLPEDFHFAFQPIVRITPDAFEKLKTLDDTFTGFTVHDKIYKDVNSMGKILFNEQIHPLLTIYDKMLQTWKINATALNPGFHGRNAISNQFQMYLNVGSAVMNPQTQYYGMRLLDIRKESVPYLKETFVKTANGKKVSLYEIQQQMLQHKVTQGNQFNDSINDLTQSAVDIEGNYTKSLMRKNEVNTQFDEPFTANAKQFDPNSLNPLSPLFDIKNPIKSITKPANQMQHKQFIGYQIGQKVGGLVEGQARATNFLANVMQGKNYLEASDNTTKYLFDYFDLSDTERKVFKRIVPFYTWMRKNIPLQIESIMTQPSIYKKYDFAKNEIQNTMPEDEKVPTRFKNSFAQDWLQLPNQTTQTNKFGKEVKMPMFMNPSLPLGDLSRIPMPSKEGLNQLISSTSPIIKTSLELMANKNLYFGTPISKGATDTEKAPGYIQLLFGGTPEKPIEMTPEARHILRNISPFAENIGKIVDTSSIKSKDTAIIKFLQGTNLYPYDVENFKKYSLRERLRVLKDLQERENIKNGGD